MDVVGLKGYGRGDRRIEVGCECECGCGWECEWSGPNSVLALLHDDGWADVR